MYWRFWNIMYYNYIWCAGQLSSLWSILSTLTESAFYCTLLIGRMTPQTKGSVCIGASNKPKPELCTHWRKKKKVQKPDHLIVTCWFCQTSSGSPANPIYTVRGDSSAGIEMNLHIKVVFTNTKCVRRALVLLFAMQQVQHTCGFWKSGMLFSLTWKTIQMNKLYKMNHSENNFHSKIASKFHNN